MVFRNKDEMLITCCCGCCNAIDFKKDEDSIFVSSLSGDFSTMQNTSISNIKHIFRNVNQKIKNNGKAYVGELMLRESEVLEMIYLLEDFISDVKYSDAEYLKNKTILHMSNINKEIRDFDNRMTLNESNPDDNRYSLELESHLSFYDLIFHNYRQYDEVYTKSEIELFIKRAKRMLKNELLRRLESNLPLFVEGTKIKDFTLKKMIPGLNGERKFICVFKNNFIQIFSEKEIFEQMFCN